MDVLMGVVKNLKVPVQGLGQPSYEHAYEGPVSSERNSIRLVYITETIRGTRRREGCTYARNG
jgi:hypothetical protein